MFRYFRNKWGGVKSGRKRLGIVKAVGAGFEVMSDADFEKEALRNKIWYRGNVAELSGFYAFNDDLCGNTSFWAVASKSNNIRKVHTGLPALVVDVLADIALGDFLGVSMAGEAGEERWKKIAKANGF
ncbi:MAG: hypothetical protein FWC69_04655, partial [Defluviitaleaceae bacterium]|nr:hypothetical protein [Defluviitaleaceae bacterium]